MNKKIFVGFTALFVVILTFYSMSKSLYVNSPKLNKLALMNVEALAQDEGFDSDHHWYNHLGDNFRPERRTCEYTDGGWNMSITVRAPYVENTIGITSSTTTTSGSRIVCVYGDGNCWNGTSCV